MWQMISAVFFGLLFLFSPISASAQWTNGGNADYVIGQADFTSFLAACTQTSLDKPTSLVIDTANGKLYICDYGNNRVLRYAYPISGDQPAAELVFGQADFISKAANAGGPADASTFSEPSGIALDATGRLWVADLSNHRLVWFDAAHTISSNKPNANGVLGQADFSSTTANRGGAVGPNTMNKPTGLGVDDSGRLWLADKSNHRVLVFDDAASKANGANADKVFGQADFTSNTAAVTQNGMDNPAECSAYGSYLFVADKGNHRVLRFDNAASKANGSNADGVLGQADFVSKLALVNPTASNMYNPWGVRLDGAGSLYVSDYDDSRVVIFSNAVSKANGAAADYVLGQADFVTWNRSTTQSLMYSPSQCGVDNINNKALIADYGNNRVLVYSATAPISGNSSPAISIANTTISFTEGGAAIQIDNAATLSDADGDADWNGGTLKVQITGNAEAGDEISISDTDGDGTVITISGTNILAGGTDVGDLSASGGVVAGGTALIITFDSDATNAIVQEVLQAVHYKNTSDSPGTSNRTITVIATDKNNGSANDTRTITVTAENDSPTDISLSSTSVDEGQPSGTVVGTLSATDPDN
ncbi:MAG: hypothetical protein JEZ12_21210 [Desulfobacterium sp.]|nr:hypothetical protein [Desulfobacterium sp.]